MWIEISSWTKVGALVTALLVLAGCAGLRPSPTPSINDKISWTGMVFAERDLASVEEHLSEVAARALVAEYDPSLEIVAIHAGELSPNVSGPSYLGYVVEVARANSADVLPVLINAEEGALAGGPGVDTTDGDQDQ